MEHAFDSIDAIDLVNNKVFIKWNSWESSWEPVDNIVIGRDSFDLFLGRIIDLGMPDKDVERVLEWMMKY